MAGSNNLDHVYIINPFNKAVCVFSFFRVCAYDDAKELRNTMQLSLFPAHFSSFSILSFSCYASHGNSSRGIVSMATGGISPWLPGPMTLTYNIQGLPLKAYLVKHGLDYVPFFLVLQCTGTRNKKVLPGTLR